jgi:hypothetical protein
MGINCVIPGGQRCGSTYLSRLISNFDSVKHPITINSEPKWFLKEYEDKNSYKLYMKEVFGIEVSQNRNIYLEKSTSYFTDINAIVRIKETLGSIPIVIVIRNPVARAISHFRFSKKHGFEELDFEKAIYLNSNEREYLREKVSANPFQYIENGLYHHHLRNWLDLFPGLKLVFLEDLVRDPSAFIEICEYLGLSKESGRNFWNSQKVNQSTNFHDAIEIKEIDFLYGVFLEPNVSLRKLLGRDLPPEWYFPPKF